MQARAEHDRVALSIGVSSHAAAHVTTAASTIVHRMPSGGYAEQAVLLELARGALLEYVPDPNILFPRSKLRTRLSVRVAESARLIAIDSFLGHRLPDDDAPFDWLDSSVRIEDAGGRLRARERFVAEGALWSEANVGVTAGFVCQGTLLVLGAGAAPLPALAAVWDDRPGVMAGVSTLPGEIGVLGRVLAVDGVSLRSALHDGWVAARLALGVVGGTERPK